MREDGGADVYAWSWPARLTGPSPYEWRGPIQTLDVIEDAGTEAGATAVHAEAQPMASPARTVEAVAMADVTPPPLALEPAGALNEPVADAWVELPEPAPAKARRSRRGRGAADAEASAPSASDVVADSSAVSEVEEPSHGDTEPSAVVDDAPDAGTQAPSPAEPEAPVEAAATVEIAAPPPEPVRLPDPAEISSPPAAPKRGWWRRGA